MIENFFLTSLNPFVGRGQELAEVKARLLNPECRLLSITGLGGSGKTRLAIQAAQGVGPHFQHGVVFVGLQPLTQGDLLVSTIAQAVGLTFYGETEPETQLFTCLREKSLLLLLDNFEHLLDKSGLVSAILLHASKVKILVTSREALNLQEEWLYPLKGMRIPLSSYATALEDYEAVQLLLYHARRTQPGFDLAAEESHVIRICQMTAGLPLAIEIAASWLKGLTASQIAAEMQDNLDMLSTTIRNVEERHRSMRAVFDQSWKLLSEDERLVFARLSVFRGGFNAASAGQVASASLSTLMTLVEKSLIQPETTNRFSIHELLRQYATEKLAAYGEADATSVRHSYYFAQLMLHYESALQQPAQIETMRAIEIDFENIRLAWIWASKSQQVADLNTMLHGLYLFGFLRSRYRDTIALFQQALEQAIPDAVLLRRLIMRRWGYLQWWYEMDYQHAFTEIQQTLTLMTAEGDTFEIAFGHLTTAYALIGMLRYAEALPHLETSRALFEGINEPYYVSWVLHRLGYVYSNLSETAKATTYTEHSLSLARVTHNRLALVTSLYNLGSDYILKGDYLKGRRYCEEALQVALETGHQTQVAHASSLIAACAFFQGDFDTCRNLVERSQAIIEQMNLLAFQSYNLSLLIVLACLQGDLEEGKRLKERALRHTTNIMGNQLLYWAFAMLACGLGDTTEARTHMQNLLQLTDLDATSAPILWVAPCAVYVLAGTASDKAVELLAWLSTTTDLTLKWMQEWSLFGHFQTQLQDMLEHTAYQGSWAQGSSLTVEEVLTYLTREFSTLAVEPVSPQLLTAREVEILYLIAAGLTNPQIAKQLVIGAGTVKTHTLNIYRKLEVANRTQALVRAQELGLLSPTKSTPH